MTGVQTCALPIYAKVNGQTADEHFQSVQTVFLQAVEMFSDFSKQFLRREPESSVRIPVELAKQVISEIDVLLSYNHRHIIIVIICLWF